MNTISLPATAEVDARNRAARTFWQMLGIDVLIAVLIVMAPAIANVEWSVAWWAALGLAVARSALGAVVSYLARKFVPPGVGSPVATDLEEDGEDMPDSEGGYI